jgi:hypothetical protein
MLIGEDGRTGRETCPSSTLSTTNLAWTWDRTRASVVRVRQLTAWSNALQPFFFPRRNSQNHFSYPEGLWHKKLVGLKSDRQVLRRGDYSSILNFWPHSQRYFEGRLKYSTVFQSFYLFHDLSRNLWQCFADCLLGNIRLNHGTAS